MKTEKTNYIDDASVVHGSTDNYICATKDGISLTFDIEFTLENDGDDYLKPSIQFKEAWDEQTNEELTPDAEWLETLEKEILIEWSETECWQNKENDYLIAELDYIDMEYYYRDSDY